LALEAAFAYEVIAVHPLSERASMRSHLKHWTFMPRTADYPINPLFTDRWSPRSFTNEALSHEQVLTLLEAARWAPSASNVQPWRFVYALRGTAHWDGIFQALVPFNQRWAQSAGALIVVASTTTLVLSGKTEATPNPWHAFDAGAAWAQLGLQAVHSGLAAHAAGGFDGDKLRQAIELPDDLAIHAVVIVGKRGPREALPADLAAREEPNGRNALGTLAFEGKFRI
jgi:nitroreductase